MTTITENKLIIELEHSDPEEMLKLIQSAIINTVQTISDLPEQHTKPETEEASYPLLELLKHTMDLKVS